jgi:hypothetical protein
MKKIKTGFVFNSKYRQWTGDLYLRKYHNGNIRIDMNDNEGPIAVITANTKEILPEDAVLVKDYFENEGILQDLIDQGVVEKPSILIPSAHVHLNLCKLLIN